MTKVSVEATGADGRSALHAADLCGPATDAAVFSVGALVLNAALYRSRLVPRWLSLWGLAGAAAYLAAGLLVMYGLKPLSAPQLVLEAPLGLQEVALALWLIVKGFDSGRDALPMAVGGAGDQHTPDAAGPPTRPRRRTTSSWTAFVGRK